MTHREQLETDLADAKVALASLLGIQRRKWARGLSTTPVYDRRIGAMERRVARLEAEVRAARVEREEIVRDGRIT